MFRLKRGGRVSKNTFITSGVAIAAVALLAGGYLLANRTKPKGVDIRMFTGHIIAAEGDTVRLSGVYYNGGKLPDSLMAQRDFTFRVDDRTLFRRSELRFPTTEELAAQGTSGTFRLEDLPRTETTGSLADFMKTASSEIYVEAKFAESLPDVQNPLASEVLYRLMIMQFPEDTPE